MDGATRRTPARRVSSASRRRCANSPASSTSSRRIKGALRRKSCSRLSRQGKFIPNNTHFDTTRANVEFSGAEAVDLPTPEGMQPDLIADSKGNIDLGKLAAFIRDKVRRTSRSP